MPAITLVNAQELDRWANSRRAQEQLPLLLRRLIHATTTTATHIGLPGGDAVQQGGYDGVVVINETHHAIPNGTSIWEIGVSANPKGKATEDYEKRKASQPVNGLVGVAGAAVNKGKGWETDVGPAVFSGSLLMIAEFQQGSQVVPLTGSGRLDVNQRPAPFFQPAFAGGSRRLTASGRSATPLGSCRS